MANNAKELVFRPIEGEWREQAGLVQGTLAECYKELGIVIDDNMEFARINQYAERRSIWVRLTALKVTITIREI